MTFGRKHKKQKRDKCAPVLKLSPIRIRISNFSFQQKTDTISIASSTTPPTSSTHNVTEPNIQNVSPNVPSQQQKQQSTSAISSMKQQVITQTPIQSPLVKLSASEVRLQSSPAYVASTAASSSSSASTTAMPSLVVSVPLSNANVPVTVLVSIFSSSTHFACRNRNFNGNVIEKSKCQH